MYAIEQRNVRLYDRKTPVVLRLGSVAYDSNSARQGRLLLHPSPLARAIMNSNKRGADVQPSHAEIQAALERVVASHHFSKSPQLANFLTFVINETLAGRGERIKAYNIAADALGRAANFDPQSDPIVRVEAGRLRRALAYYYADDGCDDPVVIDLPRGHYLPVFKANKARAGSTTRLRALRFRVTGLLRSNYQLVATIIVIAVIVSLALNMLESLWTKSSWFAINPTIPGAPTADTPPVATGSVGR